MTCVSKANKSVRNRRIMAAAVAILLLAGSIWGYRTYTYHHKTGVLTPGSKKTAIYVEPDDTATSAAANYLSLAVKRKLGMELPVVTEKEEDFRYLSILCGAESASEAASDDAAVYSVAFDGNDVIIQVPVRSRCFGAVKAIADRWLQEDCGIHNGVLYISQAIIGRQLSELPTAVSGTISILSQNLRNTDDEGSNSINERAPRFFQLVDEYQPDLIGTQECSLRWIQLLQGTLSDRYEIFGCSRNGPNSEDGDWNAILYRKDRFTLQNGETFWLSNTPSEAASKFNYSGSPRICTWALLQDSETGKKFLIGNTHLHHIGTDQEVRARQAEILLWRLRNDNMLTCYPGFLTGDFNGEPNEPFYSRITEEFEDSQISTINDSSFVNYTFHAYGNTKVLCDYCFHSPKNVTILDYRILDDQYGGYVSDHYGVLVCAILN